MFAAQVLPLSSDLENSDENLENSDENPDFAAGNPRKCEITPGTDSVSPNDPSDPNFKRFGPDNAEEALTDPPVLDHFDHNDVVASMAPTATEVPNNNLDLIREGVIEPEEKAEKKGPTRDEEQKIHGATEDPEKRLVIAAVPDPMDLRIEELSMISCEKQRRHTMWDDNRIPPPIKTAGKIPNAEADQNCLSEKDPLIKSDKPIGDGRISSPLLETRREQMLGDEKVRRWIEAWE